MSAEEGANYPELFRQMIVRGAEAALASVDPAAPTLDEDVRERSLYVLSLALDWPDAWPVTRELTIALTTPLRWQGYITEWIAYLDRAVICAELQKDFTALAKLYHRLGWFYRELNLWQQANEYLQRSYDFLLSVGDVDTRIDTLDQLSGVAADTHDFAAVKQYVDEVFALTEAGNFRRAKSYGRLGYVAVLQGNYDDSIVYYTESIQLHSAAGNFLIAAEAEAGLAMVYEYAQRYQEALSHLKHVIQLLTRYPSALELAQTQVALGLVHARLHDYEEALKLFRLSEPVFVKTRSSLWLAHLYNNYGIVYTEKGDYEQAQHFFTIGTQVARELGMPQWIANVLDSYATMLTKMGKISDAVATWEQALAELALMPEPPRRLHDLILKRMSQAIMTQGNPTVDSPGGVPL